MIKLYVRDKDYNIVHRVGQDKHDELWVDGKGTVHYRNLQNGDGCGAESVISDLYSYEFCPMIDGEISKEYLECKKPKIRPE